jgi:broad specificity phosphatase PhoE
MLRAKQTAQLAHGTPVLTYESHLVDERDLGILNTTPPFQRKGITKKFRQPSQKETGPYRWIPPGGESLEHVEYRAQALLTYLSTLGSIVNHLRIVSHAGTMGALQSLVEHLSAEEYDQLYTNEKGHSPFFNCHLLHYRGLQNGRYAERRSVCAYDPSLYDTGWQSLV